jgi:hypothetical protein
MVLWNLSEFAKIAVKETAKENKGDSTSTIIIEDPNSNDSTANQTSISIANKFLSKACPEFLKSKAGMDQDRLVKVGRSVADLVRIANDDVTGKGDKMSTGLVSVVDQCDMLAKGLKIPKVRFGKTNLQMSIVTLGTMRFQQTWGSHITELKVGDNVMEACQENIVDILKYAINEVGVNHIETANMYGSSEIQLGDVFKRLFESGVKREDVIIQTKVNCFAAKDFRKTLEDSFNKLQLEYVDLLSFHGVNYYKQYDLIFNNPDGENLMDIAKEYIKAGKVRHIGFSSHAQPELIKKCIETDAFDYANIHLHAFGSYTASGGGECGGNIENARLMKEKDMGVFIISPYDKGGKLYAPSKKLRSLTLPDLEPIQYGSLWCFHLADLDEAQASAHTIVCGAARPSDLDEPAYAAYLYGNKREESLLKVKNVAARLRQAQIDTLGEEWLDSWHKGLPNCNGDDKIYAFGQMVWLHNIIKAWGLYEFAKDRYGSFDGNTKSFDPALSNEENIQKKYLMYG